MLSGGVGNECYIYIFYTSTGNSHACGFKAEEEASDTAHQPFQVAPATWCICVTDPREVSSVEVVPQTSAVSQHRRYASSSVSV